MSCVDVLHTLDIIYVKITGCENAGFRVFVLELGGLT